MPTFDTPRTSVWPVVLIAACLGLIGACDEASPNDPTPPALAVEGRWTGTLTDRAAGSGAIELSLNGSGQVGTGTFSLVFADASANLQGQVLARTQGAPAIELSLNLTTNARDCTGAPGLFYTARLTLNGNRMTGPYESAIGCPLLRGGVLELTRR